MCTFLGTAGKISESDINVNDVKNSEITFLEGYLWDKGGPKRHLTKQLKIQKKPLCPYQIYFVLKDTRKTF